MLVTLLLIAALLLQQLLQTFKVLNSYRRHSTTAWIKQFVQEHSTLNKNERTPNKSQTNYPIIHPSRTPKKSLASIPMTHPKGTNHWYTFNYATCRGPVWILNPGWLIVIHRLSLSVLFTEFPNSVESKAPSSLSNKVFQTYHISAYSFRGNYSFLKVENVEIFI